MKLSSLIDEVQNKVELQKNHGDYLKWESIYNHLPEIKAGNFDLNSDTVKIGNNNEINNQLKKSIKFDLKTLSPWRKGPFNLFDIYIDTEWRSDWKWNRIKNSITPLKDKNIIDIGCGNGYHCYRMLGSGAENVVGIDPYLLSSVQFYTLKKFLPELPVWILPMGIDDLINTHDSIRNSLNIFDTVFSMGLLYHRKSPFDFLSDLKLLLKPGGELVLETLVIDGELNEVLVPEGRYAKMRNVWFIPSPKTLLSWLRKCGYKNPRLIDVTKTLFEEQRKTEWMEYESLADFLDKENPQLTVEGYPSPKRAFFIASN